MNSKNISYPDAAIDELRHLKHKVDEPHAVYLDIDNLCIDKVSNRPNEDYIALCYQVLNPQNIPTTGELTEVVKQAFTQQELQQLSKNTAKCHSDFLNTLIQNFENEILSIAGSYSPVDINPTTEEEWHNITNFVLVSVADEILSPPFKLPS